MRNDAWRDIYACKRGFVPGETVCPECNEVIRKLHVDHGPGDVHKFVRIRDGWLAENGIGLRDLDLTTREVREHTFRSLADEDLRESWAQWHHDRCKLRLICAACNVRLG